MKTSKSKSKSKTKARGDLKIHQSKNKRINKKIGKGKEIIVPLNCLKGKVLFNISNIDSNLVRALIKSINMNEERWKSYSLLLQLRLPKKVNQEMIYKHNIDTKEAFSLYNRLNAKLSGAVDSLQQLEQLTEIIREYNLPNNSSIPNIALFNGKIEEMRKGIKTQFLKEKKQRVKSFKQNLKNQDRIKSILLVDRIKELAQSLLGQIIVAIRQISENRVEIIFQQCYPQKTCTIYYLKSLIGEQVYNQKKINFVKYYEESDDKFKDNKNFIVCHQCKNLLVEQYARCSRQDLQQFKPSYKNSPHIYHRNLVAFDYCYHPTTSTEKLEQQMEYYRYYLHRKSFCCFRFTCLSCLSKQTSFKQPKDLHKYICYFCDDICVCKSCNLAQEILKCLALYKHILIRNDQPLDHLSELINFINLNDNQIIVQQHLRYTFSQNAYKKYAQYYYKLREQFIAIDENCNKQQQLILGDNEQESKLTRDNLNLNYIRKVRSYMIQRRQKRFNLTTITNDNRYLLEKMYHLHLENSQQQKANRREAITNKLHKQKASETNNKPLNMSLSQKINKYSIQFQNNVRFQVPSQQYYSNDDINNGKNLEKTLQKAFVAADKGVMRNLITVKQQLPYSQQDYDVALNVLPKNIIKREEHLNVDSLIQHRIFEHWNDPSFSLVQNFQNWRNHQFAIQYIEELQISDSDEQQSKQDYSQQIQILSDQSSSNYYIHRNMYPVIQDKNSSSIYQQKGSESLANQLYSSLEQQNQENSAKEGEMMQNQGDSNLIKNKKLMIEVEQKFIQKQDIKINNNYGQLLFDNAKLIENNNQALVEDEDEQDEDQLMQIDSVQFKRTQKR